MGTFNAIKFLRNIEACSVYDLVNQAAKKSLNRVTGRTRVVLSGEELKALGIESGLGNISNPKLIIGGNNTAKSQSIWGASVCDASGKPVQKIAVNYSYATQSKNPVYQKREQVFDGKKKIYTESEYIDTSKVVNLRADVKTSISHSRGMTTITAEAEDAYRISRTTPTKKTADDYSQRTHIAIIDSTEAKQEINILSSPYEVRDRLNWLKRDFKAKTPIIEQKMAKVPKMDLRAVNKEINLQQTNMQKMEQEIENMYREIYGVSDNMPNWREDFYIGKVYKVNPITGEAIPLKSIARINKKIQKYKDTRRLLFRLGERKNIICMNSGLDKNYIVSMFNKLDIVAGKTLDPIVAKEFQSLKGLPKEEIMTKVKDIICTKKGIPSDLIKVLPAPEGYPIPIYAAAFEPTNACIYYHPTLLSVPDDSLIGIINHELDHFEVASKIAKKEGLDKYKTIICKKEKDFAMYDGDVWKNLLKYIKADDFDTEPYIKALNEYVIPKDLKSTIKYYSNPLELSAYQAGMDAEIALNGGDVAIMSAQNLITAKTCTRIQNCLDELEKIAGKDFNIDWYLNKIHNQALNMIENPASPNLASELFDKILTLTERDLAKAKAGIFELPIKKEMSFVKMKSTSDLGKILKKGKTNKVKVFNKTDL